MSYRPLPKGITVGPSEIEGLGIFTLNELVPGIVLGITHVPTEDSENFYCGLIRTPLGGFLNHSIDANGKIEEYEGYHYLVIIKHTAAGDEITLNYNENNCGKQYVKNF